MIETYKPMKIRNVKTFVEDLSKLDFIVLERVGIHTYIVKKKIWASGIVAFLIRLLNLDWIGQILKENPTLFITRCVDDNYYFCDETGTLDGINKLSTLEEMEAFIKVLKKNKC